MNATSGAELGQGTRLDTDYASCFSRGMLVEGGEGVSELRNADWIINTGHLSERNNERVGPVVCGDRGKGCICGVSPFNFDVHELVNIERPVPWEIMQTARLSEVSRLACILLESFTNLLLLH